MNIDIYAYQYKHLHTSREREGEENGTRVESERSRLKGGNHRIHMTNEIEYIYAHKYINKYIQYVYISEGKRHWVRCQRVYGREQKQDDSGQTSESRGNRAEAGQRAKGRWPTS